MSGLQQRGGVLCQDDPAHAGFRGSNSSLACSVEEDWCLSPSTDGLECSEDMCFEDVETSDEPRDYRPCFRDLHLRISQPPDAAAAASSDYNKSNFPVIIRAELELQRQLNSGGSFECVHSRTAAAPCSYTPHSGAHPSPRGDDCAGSLPSSGQILLTGQPAHPRPSLALQQQQQQVQQYGTSCESVGGDVMAIAAPAAAEERLYGGWLESALADRRLLVNWMMELTRAAGLQRESLFLAISLLDRFLAANVGSMIEPPDRMLQLLAMACVSVAMKFEEVVPLHSSEVVGLAVDPATGQPLYRTSDLAQMEWRLLWALDWRARAPHPLSFLHHFLLCCCGAGNSDSSSIGGGGDGSGAAAASAVNIEGSPGDVEAAAYRILEVALLNHCDLIHCHSTVALACLVLGERAVADAGADASSAAAAAPPMMTPYSAGEPPSSVVVDTHLRCLAAVQVSSGLSLEELAPKLQPCLEYLQRLCALEQHKAQTEAAAAAAPPPPTPLAVLQQQEQEQGQQQQSPLQPHLQQQEHWQPTPLSYQPPPPLLLQDDQYVFVVQQVCHTRQLQRLLPIRQQQQQGQQQAEQQQVIQLQQQHQHALEQQLQQQQLQQQQQQYLPPPKRQRRDPQVMHVQTQAQMQMQVASQQHHHQQSHWYPIQQPHPLASWSEGAHGRHRL